MSTTARISVTALLLAVFYFCFTTQALAKKRCKALQVKLHNIQEMQRNAHSLKRGKILRKKEEKAREKWWQCEHPSYHKQKKTKSKKKKHETIKSSKRLNPLAKSKKKNNKKKWVNAPFSRTNAIGVKSSYEGNKKYAWQRFYQQPVKCKNPKNLNVFTFCSDDKHKQKVDFEQQYTPQ